jgi:hypothetical protein
VSDIARILQNLFLDVRDSYRPKMHYMRGPGPKWLAKHQPWLRLRSEGVGEAAVCKLCRRIGQGLGDSGKTPKLPCARNVTNFNSEVRSCPNSRAALPAPHPSSSL